MGNKRKVAVVRKEDCKREKAKDETEDKSAAPETENKSATPETENKGAALVEEEPNEEAWNSLTISEIKKNTCNIKGIRIFLDVIFDRLYQYFEKIQVRGFSDRGTVCIIPAERKLEAAIFEQLAYHLQRTHGMRDLIGQNASNNYYNTGFEFVQLDKYPRTSMGEIIEDIFKTVERDHFKQIAYKGR